MWGSEGSCSVIGALGGEYSSREPIRCACVGRLQKRDDKLDRTTRLHGSFDTCPCVRNATSISLLPPTHPSLPPSHHQETFKAVILSHQRPPSPPGPPATAAAAATATQPLAPGGAAAYPADGGELAAEALADDLVRSLSELLVRERAVAAAELSPAATEWSLAKLAGVSLEPRHEEAERRDSQGLRLRGAAGVALEASAAAGGARANASPRAETQTRGLFEEEGAGLGLAGSAGALEFGEEDFLQIESTWVNIVMTSVCVVCAGLAAGLTMGLLSIEPLEMAIKQRSGKRGMGALPIDCVRFDGTFSVPDSGP